MANPEHEAILRQGVNVWDQWRKNNPSIKPDLSDANFSGINLTYSNLTRVDLSGANFIDANLIGAKLIGANLSVADLSGANFSYADFSGANLGNAALWGTNFGDADFSDANLIHADFSDADLSNANLSGADLSNANLNGAKLIGADLSNTNLSRANLSMTTLVATNLEGANISDCRIFGISAWKLKTDNLKQSNLIITYSNESEITVDNLEIAQFVYLLLNNAKLRDVIDTLTTKSVLILGRFTPERKAVLDGIREALRQHGYVPMLFDFDKPTNRDLTETVMTLASLARFVIADLSDPNSIPHELMSFADKLFSVPVQGIFCPTEAHPQPYPMYEHLRRLPHVLPIYRYETADGLMAALEEKVIQPAEDKVKAVRPMSGLM